MMAQTTFWHALGAGLLSASSMPLGALTSLFWNPQKRVVAFLTAFGAGALLSAVVIDLVGGATETGHYLELVIGSIFGSIFFIVVNQIVNKSGGFLRKPSTTLVHLTEQESRRFQKKIAQLKRLSVLRDLPLIWQEKIAERLFIVNYPKGTALYSQGDPSESLYILEKGKVELQDPQAGFQNLAEISSNDIFGKSAFFTGSPHQSVAVAAEDSQLGVLLRSDFEELLDISPELVQATQHYLQSEEIADYLQTRHGFRLSEVRNWVNQGVETVARERQLLAAVTIEQKRPEFLKLARKIERFPVFSYLPAEELEKVADRLIHQTKANGFVFFQPKDSSDYLYIIEEGEIQIIYPSELKTQPLVLKKGDPFGELSFLINAPHTVTAIAKTDVAVWAIRRQDFREILQQSPGLQLGVKTFLEQPKLRDYLQTRQHLASDKARQWLTESLESMNAKHLIPSAMSVIKETQEQHDAPMAIWLGLMLDAIPEALTIGAHIAVNPISSTLLAGIFIANYPEALSSSRGMLQQGFSIPKTLIMWTSIMIVTGLLAGLGNIVFAQAPDNVISLLESMAAGAMLTVIAETMLPEAYSKGSSIVGISTLIGFLVVILINTLE
ncbi:cyclic nucleotide-binding domain-containing protein [Gloeocapsa sp. PCC 73106]|uniref:cyclic nucleotide-binding domain-containing protein n=1 Tax=Gloeocapsa sp. PCC 73106 TaxID=102232 RepID=UPI0002AC099C|nr:cyclic nucleotide-binding domain-containing protein [Gloeocapsa sp. PCC 73106]ELR97572.1 cAMP-binding protein [Gloeocapsa sp. PCC 73106]